MKGIIAIAVVLLAVAACQGETVIVEVPADTPTLQPTYTPLPTLEPLTTYTVTPIHPTNTPMPTSTAITTPPPTPRPTPTVAPVPTATPAAEPTPIPEPTAAVAPTPIPKPTAVIDPAKQPAQAIQRLPWVADGIIASERDTVDELLNIAERGPDVFVALMGRSWVNDGDITRDEAIVIDRIASTIRVEDQSLEREVMQKVIEILDMPFLDTVESPDALAMHSLEMFEDAGSAGFLELLRHPKLRDGINDEEAKTILLLGRANRHQPELVRTLLDGAGVFKEERTINLRHSGEVVLAIIRFHDQNGPNMDYLEHAVRHHENFMSEPLPTNYVAWFFVDYVSSGRHVGTHIESNPERDPAAGEYWRAPRHAAHETAHYYWRASQIWISEGGADMMVILSENARVGRPLVHNRDQCIPFNAISEIVDAEPDSDEFSCSYRLGQRLFLDLYLALGEATFKEGFRNLYLKRLNDDPTDDCEGTYLGVCHVEAAFKDGASDEVAAKVNKAIGHWYYGRTAIHEGDRAALATLYHEMNGPNWTHSAKWLSDAPIGEWYGVTTDAAGRVIELDLADNGLSGPFPSRLGNLTNLRELLLGYNRLRGPIPTELSNLTNLTRLDLNDNELTGAIPPALGSLGNLTWLKIDDNNLSGEIPGSLGNLTNLTRLDLHDNDLYGAIPASLDNLAALRYLRFAGDNRFTGCVPVGLTGIAVNDLAYSGLPAC